MKARMAERISSLKVMAFAAAMLCLALAVSAREPVSAKHAMAASNHPIASAVGAEIMKKGGNAVDAAIATGFALAVVYPEAGNIGGGGFMVIRMADGRSIAIDYREMAPAAATRDIYLNEKGDVISCEGGPVTGYRASGVPGTVAGFELAFKKYGSGKLKWAELVEPARKLAAEGYVLSRRLAELFKAYSSRLENYEDSKRIFLNGGEYFEPGDRLVQKDLAATLERIRDKGAEGFYQGTTAKLIADDMARNNGLITLDDLKNYKAVERKPIEGSYRGSKIISMPPPSSGGIVLVQVLNMLERHDLRSLGHNSADKYHLLIEAMKRAFADRAELLGDPDFNDVPTEQLIDKSYAAQRAKSISKGKATPSSELGAGIQVGNEPQDTTHYSVVDKDGNVVSNTYTTNNLYGSAVTAKGTGIILNDEMDDFASKPGVPNIFGLVQGEFNAVGPGKRPLSSMTPTIVLRPDGSFWFEVGARGGPRIISASLQTVINVIDHGMDLEDAVNAPRVHHQWLPDEVIYEPYGMSPDTIKILESYGHKFASSPRSIASATAVGIDKEGYRLGVVDKRADGAAVGY
ncbi:MAG: gamma-glutamyltransferase [Acidobacteria bacterium]|nr:MAG: gamma-glutamyltransferase [Acidobacteriota bacterium]